MNQENKPVYFTKDQLKQHLTARGITDNTKAQPIIEALIAKGAVIEGVNETPNIAQTIGGALLKPATDLIGTGFAGIGALGKFAGQNLGNKLGLNESGNISLSDAYAQQTQQIQESGANSIVKPLTGQQIRPAQSLEQLGGDIVQTGANLIPGATLGKGASTMAKIGYGALTGGITGSLAFGGQAMSEDASAGGVIDNALMGGAIGATIGGAIPGVPALYGAVKPLASGTGKVLKAAGQTLKSIPENIATNVGEMGAKEAAIKSIPSATGQNAVRKGIDITDATGLQKAIQTPEARGLIQTIKNYAAGDKSVSPFEIVGKPIVDKLKTLDTQVKNFALQLDTVAQDLKGVSMGDVSKIDDTVLSGLNKLQIGINKQGLDFVGSSLEGVGNSGAIVNNVFKRLQTARDAFDLHNLKKYIDANVTFGKRAEGLDSGAENLLKTWRKAIDDTLDTQFENYNKVNTELAKRISPLEDLKGLLKNADGLDTDLLSEKAGILARRITSAAPSNPEIKQILRNLDGFTSTTGKTLGKIENLQDLYNILNKYYDIAPKTGFQNLTKEGVQSAGGITERAIDTVKGFAGSTNATRQKALENYLDELLNPAKAKIPTKAMNSTKATAKNVIMSDGIPQVKKTQVNSSLMNHTNKL